jgi:hypothetical protein
VKVTVRSTTGVVVELTGSSVKEDPIQPAVMIPRTTSVSSARILCMLMLSLSRYDKPFNKLFFRVFFTVWQDARSISHRVVQKCQSVIVDLLKKRFVL